MRNRITIQTTEDLDRALDEVRIATGRATKSEVIRDGLELYDLVVQHLIAGKHLYLGTSRESAGEVLLPHLERAAGRRRPPLTLVQREAAPAALSIVSAQRVASGSDDDAEPMAAEQSIATKRRSDSL
jgi:hypothetical protein